jgi:hypothetical protein
MHKAKLLQLSGEIGAPDSFGEYAPNRRYI